MKPCITSKLRHNQAPWEAKLWRALRGSKLNGLKFRRQFPIDKYIVDFCCIEKNLVIELDGSHHMLPKHKLSDTKRQKIIASLGYKVIRFWNNEIDDNLDGVIQSILDNS